jgi:hypothetical protein
MARGTFVYPQRLNSGLKPHAIHSRQPVALESHESTSSHYETDLCCFDRIVVGFLAGGGLGFVQGGLGGTVVGATLGTASGMCIPVEAALIEGTLTPAQTDELAAAIGQDLRKSDPELAQTVIEIRQKYQDLPVAVGSVQCTDFLSRVAQAMESAI